MSNLGAHTKAPVTPFPAAVERPRRRLSDKVREAMQHALADGRREIADRLTLVYQAINDEEGAAMLKRRREDLERA